MCATIPKKIAKDKNIKGFTINDQETKQTLFAVICK
jgi:hypothetical protein